MDGSTGGLQSGIVLAAIVAAVLFADRFGGADQIAQRIFQLALAATLAFVVMSGTLAFIRPPAFPDQAGSSFSSSSDSFDSGSSSSSTDSANSDVQLRYFRDVANRDAARSSAHFGAGVILLVTGIGALRRWKTSGLGIATAGLLLVLFGGVHTGSTDSSNPLTSLYSSLFSAFGAIAGTASKRTDIIRFAVFGGGAVALLALGTWKWDMAPAPTDPEQLAEPV
jgi:hypothetical protein